MGCGIQAFALRFFRNAQAHRHADQLEQHEADHAIAVPDAASAANIREFSNMFFVLRKLVSFVFIATPWF